MIRAVEPGLEEGLALTGVPPTGRGLLARGELSDMHPGVPSSQ
jgi:hypothetical protein